MGGVIEESMSKRVTHVFAMDKDTLLRELDRNPLSRFKGDFFSLLLDGSVVHSRIDTSSSIPFFRSKSTRMENLQAIPPTSENEGMLVLRNKSPRWHEQL